MAKIEPGIYRIVTELLGEAITVAAGNNNTIALSKRGTPEQPGQQWFIRCSGEGYHISDCVSGGYITVENGVGLCLRSFPMLWELEFVPAWSYMGEGWKIKQPENQQALESEYYGDGYRLKLGTGYDPYGDRGRWRLERLGGLPDDEPGSTQSRTTEKYRVIGQVVEQLSQRDKQLLELASQLADRDRRIGDQNQTISDQNQRNADQTQRIADLNQQVTDQNQKITDQQREILDMKKQIEERDQELVQANREIRYLLARVAQREEPVHQARLDGTNSSGVAERAQGEFTSLRDEMERLKGLMNQLIHRDDRMPNNMS